MTKHYYKVRLKPGAGGNGKSRTFYLHGHFTAKGWLTGMRVNPKTCVELGSVSYMKDGVCHELIDLIQPEAIESYTEMWVSRKYGELVKTPQGK